MIIYGANLQDPPEVIEELINKHKEGYEVVHTVRKKDMVKAFLNCSTKIILN